MSGGESMREGEQTGEELAGKLASYPGPAYRKAYLKNLLESGNRFLASGNSRGAGYCFAKVAEGLEGFAAKSDESGPESSSSSSDSESPAPSAASPREPKPKAPRAKPKEKPLSATERVRRQWRLDRLKDAENILIKHGGRLSSLENQSYRERLEKLRHAGQAASTAAQSDKADAGILELRRRLYQRVLKSQKISLTRRRMPMTLARLALPPGFAHRVGAAASSRLPVSTGSAHGVGSSAPTLHVDTEWQPVVGPYNDRYNLEDLLSLIADADAAWVQEFLDLYRGLAGVQDLVTALAAAGK